MPFNFTQENSATIGTTEHSLPANTTVAVPTLQTDTCQVQAWVRILAMAAGDEFLVKLYEKFLAAGAQVRVEEWRLAHPHELVLVPAVVLHNGWDITVQKVSGTDRVVEWALRKVT